MSLTLRHRQTLRHARHMTPAGRFWVGYAIVFLLLAYVVVDFVTRAAG